MRRTQYALVTVVVVCIGLIISSRVTEPGPSLRSGESLSSVVVRTIDVAGDTRQYAVYAPQADMRDRPVWVFLHGGGQSMHLLEAEPSAFRDLADRENILLVFPNGTHVHSGDFAGDRQRWNSGLTVDLGHVNQIDDVSFILSVMTAVHDEYGTDQSRAYISGVSDGGYMTQRIIRDHEHPFAAAASLLANTPNDPVILGSTPVRPVPLLLWMNSDDSSFNADQSLSGLAGEILTAAETYAWWQAAYGVTEMTPAQPISDPDSMGCYTTQQRAVGEQPIYYRVTVGGGHVVPSINYRLQQSRLLGDRLGYQCADIEGVLAVWEVLRSYRASNR